MAIKLKDIKLFEWIDIEYSNMIIDNSRRVDKKLWDIIIFQWEKSTGFAYIIQEWSVVIEIDGKVVNKLDEWNLFWEMALITDEARTASVISETDTTLLQIDKILLHTIIKKFKNWKDVQDSFMKRILENIKK